MNIKSLTSIAILSAVCISCSKEMQAPDETQAAQTPEMVYITASDGASKTSLSGGVNVLWSSGDKLKVFSNSNTSGAVFDLSAGAGTTSGTFCGEAISGTTFYAAYPETAGFDGNTFTYTLPAEFNYVADSFAEGTNPMLGSNSSLTSFAMKNLCGVLKLQLKGSMKVTEFELTFSNSVCGQGTVSKDGTTLSMESGAGKTITVKCPDLLSLSETTATDLFISIPTGTYTSLEIKSYYTLDRYSQCSITSSFTINRAKKTAVSVTIPSPEDRPTIATCSSNIYSQSMDGSSESSQKWANRKAGLFAFFKDRDYDVFCTQECEYRQRKEFLSNLSGYSAYGKGCWLGNESDSGKEYDWELWEYVYNNEDAGNVIFYKTDKFNVLDKGTFWLYSGTPMSPAKYSKSKHYHTCSWMKLQYKSNNYTFYVFNTHLENGYTDDGGATRAYEMPILYDKVNSINSDKLPMMIYGDFNGSTTDIWGYCADSQTGWYWARNQDGKTNKDSYPTSLNNWKAWPDYKGSNVDHIAYKYFYEGSTGGKHGLIKGSFNTVTDTWAGVALISDHYPIEAEFQFDYQ